MHVGSRWIEGTYAHAGEELDQSMCEGLDDAVWFREERSTELLVESGVSW